MMAQTRKGGDKGFGDGEAKFTFPPSAEFIRLYPSLSEFF